MQRGSVRRSPGGLAVLAACLFAAPAAGASAAEARGLRLHRYAAAADPPEDGPQIAAKIAQDAADSAWAVAGEATEGRVLSSHLRALHSFKKATAAKEKTDASAKDATEIAPKARYLEKEVEAQLKKAQEVDKKAAKLIDGVKEKAYASAKAGAEAQVALMEQEATAYYASLEAELAELSKPAKSGAAEAAAKAAGPYVNVVLRVQALILYYQGMVEKYALESNKLVETGKAIAAQAVLEQASGDGVMAQRHMMQAHGLVALGNAKKADAKKIRKLVENLNSSIPNYQKAAQMAAEHALATFAGLQVGKSAHAADLKEEDPWKTQKTIFEQAYAKSSKTLKEVDDSIAEMERDLQELEKISQ